MEDRIITEENKCAKEEKEVSTFYMSLSRGVIRLEKLGEQKTFPKDHIFIEPDKIAEECYVLKEGCVVSYEITMKGEERMYHFYDKDTVFLDSDLLAGRPVQMGYRALSDCSVICIQKADLINAILDEPQIGLDIIESISNKLHSSVKQAVKLQGHTATWKVCEYLISLAEHDRMGNDNKIVIKEKTSQQTIAKIVGVNRITVVRIMKELKERGYLEHKYGCFTIADYEGLVEYQKSLKEKQ